MKKYNLNFSHTNYFVIDKNEKKIGKFKSKSKIEYQDLLKSCDIGLSTVIVKKNLLRKIYFVIYELKKIFIYGYKLLKRKKIFSINKYLSYWRYLENSLSSPISQRLIDAFRLYYTYEKNNFFTSVYYVIRLSYYAFIKKLNIYKTYG